MTALPFLRDLNRTLDAPAPETPFKVGATYATRAPFEFRRGVPTCPATATITHYERDELGRLWVHGRLSNGHPMFWTARGQSGLGYPQPTDLMLPGEPARSAA